MKPTLLLAFALLSVHSFIQAEDMPILGTPRSVDEINQSQAKIEITKQKLNSVILSKIDCKNEDLWKVLSSIDQLIRSSPTEKEGIHIVVKKKESGDYPPITLSATSATLGQVLTEIGKQTGLSVVPSEYAIKLE